jgi:hypothetical protein
LQQAGYNFAGALGGAMGGVDPQLQRISTLNAISKQIDQTNPKSMLQGAKLLADAGFTQEAFGLSQYAREASAKLANASKSKAEADKIQYAQDMDEKLRIGLSELPEDATEEDVMRVVAKFGSPDKTLATYLLSQDKAAQRKVTLDVATKAGEDKVEAEKIKAEAKVAAAEKDAAAMLAAAKERGATAELLKQMQIDSNAKLAQMKVDANKQIADAQNQTRLDIAKTTAQINAGNRELQAEFLRLRIEKAKSDFQNKPLPPSLVKDEIKDLELIDSLEAQVTSLTPALNNLKVDPKTGKAPLELGPINNLKYQAAAASGFSTPESRAYADLERSVQAAVNLRTSAEKGVQTDKDVLRFANELIAAFGKNDTKTTLEALSNFVKASEKAKENTLRKIEQRRASVGAPAFAPVGAAPAVVPTKRWNSQTNRLEEVK